MDENFDCIFCSIRQLFIYMESISVLYIKQKFYKWDEKNEVDILEVHWYIFKQSVAKLRRESERQPLIMLE